MNKYKLVKQARLRGYKVKLARISPLIKRQHKSNKHKQRNKDEIT